jgi:ABC-type lipoprotein release transport system permease subunit
MHAQLETLLVIVEIAVRNLFASRWKTLIVGGITGFGALLIVLGSSLLDSVDQSMRRSITGSIAGHIQVYSAEAKDDLEILGNFYVDIPDIGALNDFAKVRRTLLSVPNVSAVVPMGFSDAVASSGNSVDQALDALRETINARSGAAEINPGSAMAGAGAGVAAGDREYASQKAHVREIVAVLRKEIEDAKQVSEAAVGKDELAAIDRALSNEFWANFDNDALGNLEFLEARVAPFAADADLLFLRYVGTDPTAFARAFDRLRIVDGQPIPPGERGFLFSKFMYEEQVKLKAARGLDYIKSARDDRYAKIALDPDLQRVVDENTSGVNELLLQLDATKTASFRAKLQAFLHSSQADVGQLLASFFATDDRNFDQRYAFFYQALAPELQLYRVGIGDTLTLKTLTRTGYMQTVNVKVYGTFVFDGLEKSPQAGAINIIDLVTFRELYGFMTVDREREIEAMRASAGAVDVNREDAEAALFGTKSSSDVEATPAADVNANQLSGLRGTRARLVANEHSTYDPKQLEQGVVLNAAVVLHDDHEIAETMQAIEQAAKRAGLKLRVVSWQKAAGLLGQFATLMRGVLFAAVLIIFVVALVVINNALVMATLDRVGEIGTLRAIGAQRRFILTMLLVESGVIGLLSGGLGAMLGGITLVALHKTGIPAWSDVMTFYFSGARLFPTIGLQQLLFSLSTVVLISLISGVYPAWLAMRVSPREAMHAED